MRGDVVAHGSEDALRLVLGGEVHKTLEEGLLSEWGVIEEWWVKVRVGGLTRRRQDERSRTDGGLS
jgi:hypothetical protein